MAHHQQTERGRSEENPARDFDARIYGGPKIRVIFVCVLLGRGGGYIQSAIRRGEVQGELRVLNDGCSRMPFAYPTNPSVLITIIIYEWPLFYTTLKCLFSRYTCDWHLY